MRRGYVRLWRCSEDSAVWQDDGLWRLWCHLIIHARYKDGWVTVDRVASPVELKRGQLIVGRFTLHRALYPKKRKSNPSPITTWRRLQILENLANVIIQTNSRYTIVTVCQYDTYNPSDGPVDHISDQQVISDGSAGDQQVITKKKEKKEEEGKEGKKEPTKAGPTPSTKAEELRAMWNRLEGFPKARTLNSTRLTSLRARLKEPGWWDAVPETLEKMAATPFCLGKNDRGWVADLSWFLKPDSMSAILEGKYLNNGDGRPVEKQRDLYEPAKDPDFQ